MCGICGIIDFSSCSLPLVPIVQDMVSALHHRGPDHTAVSLHPPAALGHSRLSILDLSHSANQPMHSVDGRFHLVFNGEIYNFKELCSTLRQQGHTFQTSSDTEVLLRLYESYGTGCISRLEGMFAFAVWDSKKESLFIARDRFGQKNIYYHTSGSRFGFASEVQALLCDPTIPVRPNLNAIYQYLTVQSVPAPLSSFQDVQKLAPGECLLFTNNGIRKWRHWAPKFTSSFTGSVEEATEELESLLTRAVDTHMVSDVPLGFFLSGGVDSSLLTALACKQRDKIQSFAMGFADPLFDERPFAEQVAIHCGTQHHEETASEALCSFLPELVRKFGEPFADSSAIPMWLLSRMTSKHITVALSGDGGDDLFGGYERFLDPFIFSKTNPPGSWLEARRQQLVDNLASQNKTALYDSHLNTSTTAYYFHWARFCGNRKRLLATEALRLAAHPQYSIELLLERLRAANSIHPLDTIQQFEMDYYLATTLMPKVDIASMASSLEVRMPFLDNNVADFALSLPVNMRVHRLNGDKQGAFEKGYEPKWIVKRLAEKYLPSTIVYRRKKGFGVPLANWLREGLREILLDTLCSKSFEKRGWVNPEATKCLLKEHLEHQADHHHGLWTLLMLELWAQEFQI